MSWRVNYINWVIARDGGHLAWYNNDTLLAYIGALYTYNGTTVGLDSVYLRQEGGDVVMEIIF
ncbi:MAG: hypothetical protein R2801_04595 [Chitinophagales bacterium]